jgi:hypothetical protein
MVLTVSFVLSPVIGLVVTVICVSKHRFDASVEASGPHDFAVRLGAVRQRHLRVHRIPPRVRDDTRYAPLVGRDGADYCGDLRPEETEIFFEMGLDRQISWIGFNRSSFWSRGNEL